MAGGCTIKVLPLWQGKQVYQTDGVVVVSTVSKSAGWQGQLSPFVLGPCRLYGGYVSKNMENGWQYAKVYKEHTKPGGAVAKSYWPWAFGGWANERAVRYPMGRGRRPEYSLWDGEHLSYVEARKRIYIPLYSKAVAKTGAFKNLRKLYHNCKELVLLDYDAYDHTALGMTLEEVIENPDRKMGHAFVLAMMLEGVI